MDVRRSCEPRQKTRVLYWVPCPYSAPPEHFVTPPTTQDDAESEKPPCTQGPPPRFNEPAFTDAPRNERSNSKSKWNGEAHIAQIQNGRVEENQNVILQERVGPWPIGDARCTHPKGVCRRKTQQEKECQNNKHHGHCPCNERIVKFFAIAPHHCCT